MVTLETGLSGCYREVTLNTTVEPVYNGLETGPSGCYREVNLNTTVEPVYNGHS